jgi:hypothetical protein
MEYTLPPQYAMHLEAYSHGFRVSRFNDNVRRLLVEFCRRYVKTETSVDRSGRYMTEVKKVFAAATAMRNQYFFHRNVLEEFYEHMQRNGILASQIHKTERPMYAPAPAHLEWIRHEITFHGYQDEIMDFCAVEQPRTKLICLQAGQGKALTMDTLVKIPGGWKRMGDFNVGDQVIAKDGTPTEVTGVHPQGVTDTYRVGFWDGRWIDTCGEHLWKVYNDNTVVHNRWKIRDTLDIADALKLTSSSNRVYIDLADPEDSPEQELPIDPYVLGSLLGDGCIAHGSLVFTSADQFIIDEITRALPDRLRIVKLPVREHAKYDYRISLKDVNDGGGPCPWRSALRDLGLFKVKGKEKFVPESYLHSSIKQRYAILQGLMDTDGTAGKDGTVTFSTGSERLANHVQYLVRSLGGIATLSSRYTQYTHNGEKRTGQLSYKVAIRHKYPTRLFRLPRKKERVRDDNQYAKSLKLKITSVVPMGQAETQCISVAHPDRLFVAKSFIVTHNTLATIGYMMRAQTRTVLVMKPMYMEQWKKEILKSFKLKQGDFYVVEGSKALKDLIRLAKEDEEFNPSVILISNATYRNYLRSFFDDPTQMSGYDCNPWEFFELMRAGLVAVDEVHQDFHFNFITHCMSNMYKYAAMSATMVSDDSTMNKYYRIMFPADTYAPRPALKKYIDLYDVYYRFDRPDLIKFTQRGAYHQSTFEHSIMKRKTVLKNYTDMIIKMVEHQFFKHPSYRPGMKALVFCDRVDMCGAVRDAIQAKFTDRKITRFCATVDPEENLYDEKVDVVVTTLKSCGTARDIAKVTICICSTALSGRQASEQLIHRLRELKGDWASIVPRFVFLSSRDNQKHLKYSEDRHHKLAHVVKNFNTLTASFII